MNNNMNSPAFPTLYGFNAESGMSLRDYFAAKAMQSLIQTYNEEYYSEKDEKDIAKWSYEFADAMIAQREKQKK